MSSDSDKLKEQADLINLAMESVLSEDQAKELIQGRITDAFLLKMTIDVENRSGLVLAVLSMYKNEILVMYSVFSDSQEIKRVRTFEDAGQFTHDFIEATKGSGVDRSLSESVGRQIYKKMDKALIASMQQFLESGEANRLNTLLKDSISEGLKVKNVKLQIDSEKISSVKFRHNSPLDAVTPVTPPAPEGTPEAVAGKAPSIIDKEMEKIEKAYPKTQMCKTVLSPVAGVEFEELRPRQKLLFQIPIDSEEAKQMAKMLGAVDEEGNPRPIVGEFVHILSGKNEHYIYAKGPGGILLKAFEEGRVKLAVPKAPKTQTSQTAEPAGGGKMNLVIAAILAILVLLLGVMFML